MHGNHVYPLKGLRTFTGLNLRFRRRGGRGGVSGGTMGLKLRGELRVIFRRGCLPFKRIRKVSDLQEGDQLLLLFFLLLAVAERLFHQRGDLPVQGALLQVGVTGIPAKTSLGSAFHHIIKLPEVFELLLILPPEELQGLFPGEGEQDQILFVHAGKQLLFDLLSDDLFCDHQPGIAAPEGKRDAEEKENGGSSLHETDRRYGFSRKCKKNL